MFDQDYYEMLDLPELWHEYCIECGMEREVIGWEQDDNFNEWIEEYLKSGCLRHGDDGNYYRGI